MMNDNFFEVKSVLIELRCVTGWEFTIGWLLMSKIKASSTGQKISRLNFEGYLSASCKRWKGFNGESFLLTLVLIDWDACSGFSLPWFNWGRMSSGSASVSCSMALNSIPKWCGSEILLSAQSRGNFTRCFDDGTGYWGSWLRLSFPRPAVEVGWVQVHLNSELSSREELGPLPSFMLFWDWNWLWTDNLGN